MSRINIQPQNHSENKRLGSHNTAVISVDFKKAYDSIGWQSLFNALKEFGIREKTSETIKQALMDPPRKSSSSKKFLILWIQIRVQSTTYSLQHRSGSWEPEKKLWKWKEYILGGKDRTLKLNVWLSLVTPPSSYP